MQARRKTRLYLVLAVLAGLGLAVTLVLYALSTNIDLFYTPGKSSTAKMKRRKSRISASACAWGAMLKRVASNVMIKRWMSPSACTTRAARSR